MIAEEHPAALVSVVTTVIAGEMALGLAFNIGVLMVSRGRLVKGAEHGNTFLASLSAVDIVACLTALPFTIVSARLSRYHNNLIFCLFSEGAVALSTTSSSLTLLCITLERYQAVTRPAHRGLLSLKPFVFLLFIWILSAFRLLCALHPSPTGCFEQERNVLGSGEEDPMVVSGIVCVFLLCWGPHVMLTVLEMVQQDSLQLEAAHLVTLMLAYLTVVIHPLIYAFSRKKFRESLARLWRRFREKRRRQAHVGPAS
ncbi:probable G-protein coupled receptor 22 [Pomacea canaliculata]|uniref:probable G-protein coupled receptor 22 n=1 Tax=Pomacea canaliculata TaxID=400727 RepID=UPI000D725712|nr:probable G-protein coupled receptor 22 [Pomacea canaliculata]